MNYDSYRYLFGPRPSGKPILPASIKMMENLGYVAQKKKNGTYTLIFARAGEVIFKTRHPELDEGNHRAWQPNAEHKKFFSSLGGEWTVFCAELLHNKGPQIKDELFIHDVIVNDGKYLVGVSFLDRQKLLAERWSAVWKDEADQFRVNKHVTVAKVFTSGFRELFENLGPLDEGLVFKLPKAPLKLCVSDAANSGWSQKCRAPKAKTYSF